MRFLYLLAFALLISASSYAESKNGRTETTTVIGVLEELHGHYSGEPNFRSVRVLFENNGREWKAYPSDCGDQDCLKAITSKYPRQITWNVGISGENLGSVIGHTPEDFEWYADVGLQKIISKKPIPSVGKRSSEYGGYSGDALLPPLIANSIPYFSDPELWKQTSPAKEIDVALQSQIKRKLPENSACKDQSEPIEMKFHQFFSSKNGWSLAQINLYGHRAKVSKSAEELPSGIQHLAPLCGEGAYIINGVTLIGGFPWVAISPEGNIKYLGEGLRLVDIGDYNNDKKSEVLFAIDGDNLGGYGLFYNGFEGYADFRFNYH